MSNAIGPYAAIYHIWSTGEFSTSKNPVPIWILAFGGAMIVIGLATYGYNIMKVLGNNITMHSPSRGFSMELGASIVSSYSRLGRTSALTRISRRPSSSPPSTVSPSLLPCASSVALLVLLSATATSAQSTSGHWG